MTNREALQVLDRATSLAPLSREQHVLVVQAIQLLTKFVEANENPIRKQSEEDKK